jgi:hypothetical protein
MPVLSIPKSSGNMSISIVRTTGMFAPPREWGMSTPADAKMQPGRGNYYLLTERGAGHVPTSTATKFVNSITDFLSSNRERDALRSIVDGFDLLMKMGSFDECDRILEEGARRMPELSHGAIVSFLGITWAARARLSARDKFYRKAMDWLVSTLGQEQADSLLRWFI